MNEQLPQFPAVPPAPNGQAQPQDYSQVPQQQYPAQGFAQEYAQTDGAYQYQQQLPLEPLVQPQAYDPAFAQFAGAQSELPKRRAKWIPFAIAGGAALMVALVVTGVVFINGGFGDAVAASHPVEEDKKDAADESAEKEAAAAQAAEAERKKQEAEAAAKAEQEKKAQEEAAAEAARQAEAEKAASVERQLARMTGYWCPARDYNDIKGMIRCGEWKAPGVPGSEWDSWEAPDPGSNEMLGRSAR